MARHPGVFPEVFRLCTLPVAGAYCRCLPLQVPAVAGAAVAGAAVAGASHLLLAGIFDPDSA